MSEANYAVCDHVTPDCPVEATTYGYYPNLGVNSFFVAFFGLLLLVQLVLGIKTKTWTYTIALGVGTLLELLGYIGRVLMHFNPWNNSAFEMEVCCLILAPSFVAAAIYLTMKHLVLYCGPQYSRLRPRLYPWVFIGCDLGSIVLQAIGGGVAASAGHSESVALLNAGDGLIIAGIAFQVATMAVCGVLIADYLNRRSKITRGSASEHSPEKTDSYAVAEQKVRRRLHIFCAAVAFAYLTILIRCIYRLPEMAGGWGNPRMRRETEFLILDGMMVALATLALTSIHAGLFFPMIKGTIKQKEDSVDVSD